jgi:hypothetical protein
VSHGAAAQVASQPIPILYVGAAAEPTPAVTGAALSVPQAVTGARAGDLLVMCAEGTTASLYATNAATAAGFSRADAQLSAGGSPNGAIFTKWADGTESGNLSLTSPGGTTFGRIFAYRNVNRYVMLNQADQVFGSSTSVSNYDVPDVTPSMVGCAAVLFAWSNAASGTWTPPSGYTEVWDSTGGAVANAVTVCHRLNITNKSAQGLRTIVRSAAVRGGAIGLLLQPA